MYNYSMFLINFSVVVRLTGDKTSICMCIKLNLRTVNTQNYIFDC